MWKRGGILCFLLLGSLPVARLGSATALASAEPRSVRALDASLAEACSEVSSPERPRSGRADYGPFRLNFGKHRGKLICEVSREYAQWMVRSGIHKARPDLHAALALHGLLPLNPSQKAHGCLCTDVFERRPAKSTRIERDGDGKPVAPSVQSMSGRSHVATELTATIEDTAGIMDVEAVRASVQESKEKEEARETAKPVQDNSTAWQSAAAHVGRLRRSTITQYFPRTGHIKSFAGVHTHLPRQQLACESSQQDSREDERLPTPSPRRTRAAGRMRDELSWIRAVMCQALKEAPGRVRALAANSSLVPRFVRPLPALSARYTSRLATELQLIGDLGFEDCFLQVLKVLEIARGMPYLIRGSAAGSLVCYLLAISHIDPVKEGMSLARFMNALRNDLPDIDLDFPHDQRDTIFQRLFQMFPDEAARISNRVSFRERSAKREAARQLHVRRRVARDQSPSVFFDGSLAKVYRDKVEAIKGTHRGYSLHCGGVVIVAGEDGTRISPGDWLRSEAASSANRKFPDDQIKLDKRDCQARRLFKVDILSNRALSHLWGISGRHVYEYPSRDEATRCLLLAGDVFGILYCESPAMRRALRVLQPSSRRELALALALIRPAAQGARGLSKRDIEERDDVLVFDDDASGFLSAVLGCGEDEAEMLRKGIAKGQAASLRELEVVVAPFLRHALPRANMRSRSQIDKSLNDRLWNHVAELDRCSTTPHEMQARLEKGLVAGTRVREVMAAFEHSSKYSFCKSHAMGYAHLCWALAYEKAHTPAAFWREHARAVGDAGGGHTVYRPWVYKRAAWLAGNVSRLAPEPRGSAAREGVAGTQAGGTDRVWRDGRDASSAGFLGGGEQGGGREGGALHRVASQSRVSTLVCQRRAGQMDLKGREVCALQQFRLQGTWWTPLFLPGCFVRSVPASAEQEPDDMMRVQMGGVPRAQEEEDVLEGEPGEGKDDVLEGVEGEEVEFVGLFACGRRYKKDTLFITIGVDNGVFLDLSFRSHTSSSSAQPADRDARQAGERVQQDKATRDALCRVDLSKVALVRGRGRRRRLRGADWLDCHRLRLDNAAGGALHLLSC